VFNRLTTTSGQRSNKIYLDVSAMNVHMNNHFIVILLEIMRETNEFNMK